MSARRYLQLDVFASRPGTGNPLGVIVDSEGLDDAALQAIAAWLNLSETIFFLPPDEGASYHIRIFTPKGELPFAGHPSVGAAWAAVELGLATPDDNGQLIQQCAAGLLPVRVQGGRWFRQIHVRSPQAERRETVIDKLPDGLAALAKLFPPLPAPARPLDLFINPIPRFWLGSDGRRQVLGVFNWSDETVDAAPPRTIEVPHKGTDIWTGRSVTIGPDTRMKPRSGWLLRC